MRAYELMVIFDNDVSDAAISGHLKSVNEQITDGDGLVVSTDNWGKRRFAYRINLKWEGTYVVIEFVTEVRDLEPLERSLRLADDVVRHKLIRLPEHEADRRGLLGGTPAPAAADA